MLNQYRNISQSQAKVIKKTVSFTENGGSTVNDIIMAKGHIIPEYRLSDILEPSKTSYVFHHWCSSSILTTEWLFSSRLVDINTILYAKWINFTLEDNMVHPADTSTYAEHLFGNSMSLGKTKLAIGLPAWSTDNTGAVFMYKVDTDYSMLQTSRIDVPTDSYTSKARFGKYVANNDKYLITTCESSIYNLVYIFDLSNNSLLYTKARLDASSEYGEGSLSISDTYFAIGDSGANYNDAYVFKISDGTLKQTFNNIGANQIQIYGDYFLTNNGSTTYLYKISDGTLVKSISGTVTNSKMSVEYLAIADSTASTNAGQVKIYRISDFKLMYTISNPNNETTSSADKFGSHIDMNNSFIFIGASQEEEISQVGDNQGTIYIYRLSTGTKLKTLINTDIGSHSESQLGPVVCNDTDFFISAPYEDVYLDGATRTNAGIVFHYEIK